MSTIDHPAHYNAHPTGIECIDIVEHFNFNLGNAIKYIWRAGLKSNDATEDLRKAAWYVNREIERIEANALRDGELFRPDGGFVEPRPNSPNDIPF